jgi:hypothetical protein
VQESAEKLRKSAYFGCAIYNRENGVKLSMMAMMMMFAACAASHSKPSQPWRIEIVTAGGFAGKGAGNFAIGSDGGIAITSMGGRRCTFQATAEELGRFETLLGNAQPEKWKDSYVPENPCCDRFEYTMTVDEAGVKRETQWVDDPAPMPKDLAAIVEAMVGGEKSLRVQYGSQCQG